MLDIKGALISIDAMDCQKAIAVAAQADYVLSLKDNHSLLCEDIRVWLNTENTQGRLPIHETIDKSHGCIEILCIA